MVAFLEKLKLFKSKFGRPSPKQWKCSLLKHPRECVWLWTATFQQSSRESCWRHQTLFTFGIRNHGFDLQSLIRHRSCDTYTLYCRKRFQYFVNGIWLSYDRSWRLNRLFRKYWHKKTVVEELNGNVYNPEI